MDILPLLFSGISLLVSIETYRRNILPRNSLIGGITVFSGDYITFSISNTGNRKVLLERIDTFVGTPFGSSEPIDSPVLRSAQIPSIIDPNAISLIKVELNDDFVALGLKERLIYTFVFKVYTIQCKKYYLFTSVEFKGNTLDDIHVTFEPFKWTKKHFFDLLPKDKRMHYEFSRCYDE